MNVPVDAIPEKGVYATLSALVTSREADLVRHLTALRRRPWLAALFMTATRLGDGPLWYALGAACLTLGDRRIRFGAVAAGLAVGISAALFTALKTRVSRPRPFEVWADLPCLMVPPDRFSFPSGHTMTAFAVFAAFRITAPEIASLLLPMAVLVGISRIFLGVHYPSDVLAGGLLGTGIGAGTGYLVFLLLP